MLSNVRMLKFAATGFFEDTLPTTVEEAVKFAAFSTGFLTEALESRDKLASAEVDALNDMSEAITASKRIVTKLAETTRKFLEFSPIEVTAKHLDKAASEGALSVHDVMKPTRTKVASARDTIGVAMAQSVHQGLMNKMAKSLDILGVSPEMASFISNNRAPIGLTVGTLALLAGDAVKSASVMDTLKRKVAPVALAAGMGLGGGAGLGHVAAPNVGNAVQEQFQLDRNNQLLQEAQKRQAPNIGTSETDRFGRMMGQLGTASGLEFAHDPAEVSGGKAQLNRDIGDDFALSAPGEYATPPIPERGARLLSTLLGQPLGGVPQG